MNQQRQKAMDDALAAIDWQYSPKNPVNVARYRAAQIKRRTDRRKLVAKFMAAGGYWPMMRYLSEIGHGTYLSTDDAIASIRERLRILAVNKATGHWSYPDSAWKVRAYRERLIVARYFAMHGADIWQKDAA